MAPKRQLSIQTPHLMHLPWSMTWGARTAPVMAPAGQFLAQRVQPLHFSASTVYRSRFLQTPAGQRYSATWDT